jgi:hypothetical protein
MILHEPIAVAVHTETVVTHAMKQKDRAAICLFGPNEPRAQDDTVGGHNLDFAEPGVFVMRNSLDALLVVGIQRTVAGMQCHPSQPDTAKEGAGKVQDRENEERAPQDSVSQLDVPPPDPVMGTRDVHTKFRATIHAL